MNSLKESPKAKSSLVFSETRFKKKEIKVWQMKLPSASFKISSMKNSSKLILTLKPEIKMMKPCNNSDSFLMIKEERAWWTREESNRFKKF
jgi:hypothetical protein